MVGGAGTPVIQGSLSWEHVHSKLLQLFRNECGFEAITDWVSVSKIIIYHLIDTGFLLFYSVNLPK